jgi:hypothetical protein
LYRFYFSFRQYASIYLNKLKIMKQLYTLLLMLPAMLFAQTDIDFQSISSGLPGPNWTWTADQTDTSFDAVDNPFATGINTSSKVGELTAAAGSVAYALAYSDGIGSFTFDANNTTVKIMVYKSRISPIEIKFEDASDASVSVSRTVSNTVINDWEELTFDFYSTIGNTSYGKIVIIPDNLARTEANITYFDNITFTAGVAPVGPSVAAPTPPTRDAADVVSFYSDAYATAAMEEYFPSWMVGTVSDNPIDGNNTWKMDGLGFAALANYGGIDLSTMEKMYIDYYTTQDVVGAKLFVKLIDTNDSQEVLLDLGAVTAGSWQTVEVDLTAQNTANIDLSTVTQFLIDPSTDGGTFFIDNWYFANVPEPGPSAAAPTPPARNAADVISLYSDAYTDVASNFDAGWCGPNSVSEISVAGNATTAYLGNVCQGIVLNAGVDASAFTNLHVDIYIEAGTDLTSSVFNLKFVNQPGGNALEMNLNVASSPALIEGQWLSVDLTVDLTNFTGFKEFGVTSNLNNKVWYDNLYAYKGTPLGINEVNSFSVVTYPNPVENTLNVSAGISVDSVSIFDITGREVLRAKPNATAFSLDVADLNKGLYLVTVKAGKQEITTKLVK